MNSFQNDHYHESFSDYEICQHDIDNEETNNINYEDDLNKTRSHSRSSIETSNRQFSNDDGLRIRYSRVLYPDVVNKTAFDLESPTSAANKEQILEVTMTPSLLVPDLDKLNIYKSRPFLKTHLKDKKYLSLDSCKVKEGDDNDIMLPYEDKVNNVDDMNIKEHSSGTSIKEDGARPISHRYTCERSMPTVDIFSQKLCVNRLPLHIKND